MESKTMFREMRRARQALPQDQTEAILREGAYGVLCVAGDLGYPYGVPVNYVLSGGAIYIHCAGSGHKIDAIRACGKVSLCVVRKAEINPSVLSTDYESVVAFCDASVVEDMAEKRAALTRLCEKYAADYPEQSRDAIEKSLTQTAILRLAIKHMQGKTDGRHAPAR